MHEMDASPPPAASPAHGSVLHAYELVRAVLLREAVFLFAESFPCPNVSHSPAFAFVFVLLLVLARCEDFPLNCSSMR